MDKKEALITLCKDLRLPSIRRMVKEGDTFKNEAEAVDVLYEAFVQEKADRAVRARQGRIRAANFTQKKLLDELPL